VFVVFLVVAVVAAVGTQLTWTAKRLDRLHERLDAAAVALDHQLRRRAAAATALVRAALDRGALDEPSGRTVLDVSTTLALITSDEPSRYAVENRLSHALAEVIDPRAPALHEDSGLAPLLAELGEARATVALAVQFHATAVDDTLVLRRRPLVRYLGLAGRAPMPQRVPLDDTPETRGASAVHGPR
jgi:hypothetical protein